MISSTHPAFAKLGPKLERVRHELANLDAFLNAFSALTPELAGQWGRVTATASAIHNAYNGLEDVMLNIANDIDGYVPTGDASHQDLLDQMRAELLEKRPPVIDGGLYADLTELKGFRHLARHRYGFDLDPGKTEENRLRMTRAFPKFVEAVRKLERYMAAGAE